MSRGGFVGCFWADFGVVLWMFDGLFYGGCHGWKMELSWPDVGRGCHG
jgi:hypothetical protein